MPFQSSLRYAVGHAPLLLHRPNTGSGPWLYLGGVAKFSWRHFKLTQMIADDVHLRRHQDRKIGNFLLQLLVPSDFDGSSRKTCKNDDDDDDDDDEQLQK